MARGWDVFRVVLERGREDYEHLIRSGLYEHLVDLGLLVPHEELPTTAWQPPDAWRVLRPTRVPFISYAPEWCFSQLRDAALVTLRVQREALRFDMVLKDAPTSNVQFLDGRPVLIDTLSLVRRTGTAWAAYYQFCKHFLAPLFLVAYRDPRLLGLLAAQPDGIPLDLASELLPLRSWCRPSALMHVHLHARAERRAFQRPASAERLAHSRMELLAESLLRSVERLDAPPAPSQWTAYEATRPTYTAAAWAARTGWVAERLERGKPALVWDLGAATGHMSRLAADHGAFTVAFDADPACVDLMYRAATAARSHLVMPLVLNLLQPTASGGWAQEERTGLAERGPADLLLVLGLVHHLAVPGAIPFARQMEFFARIGRAALVEYVPPDDPVVREWSTRFEVNHLDEAAFQAAAAAHFTRQVRQPLPESGRVLYHLSNV